MKSKVTVYMSDALVDELREASELQQRSVSWLVEHSWRLSRSTILGYPAVSDGDDEQLAS